MFKSISAIAAALFLSASAQAAPVSVSGPATAAASTAPATAPASATKKADLLPFSASEKTLPNGLRVIVVPTGFPNIVSLQIPVQTGSRNEVEPGKSGFAHFFEHMMFRGTKAYPPDKYQEIITKSGARQNAYTTDDYTNYHTTFAKEDLETILKVEADRFQNLSYPVDAFKTESRAVLGEYNKNSANPTTKLFEVMRDKAFQKHTYKHTTMGFLADIEDMPNQYEYSKLFFDRWYRPENTTVIIAGDVNAKDAFALVEKYWGKWKRGNYKVAIPAEPAPNGPLYAHVTWPAPTLPWIAVSFRSPAFSTTAKDFAALDTLLSLSFGRTSDLYKRLVEDEQKVDQLFDYTPGNVDPSLATIGARVKKLEDVVYVRDAILRTVAGLRSTPVAAQRLADAKSAGKYGLIRSLDNTEQIAGTLARFVRYQRQFATINDYYRVVDSLTPEDLLAAARKYLRDDAVVVATLSKDAMPKAIEETPQLASFAPARDTATGNLLVQKTALPQIRFKLLFTAGAAQDPPGKEGLAALTAAMVTRAGSKERKIDELSKLLFPIAGSFSDQVDKEMTSFTGAIHQDNWKKFTDIALPMLLSPGFREEDFRRLKDAQKNALQLDLKDNNEEEFGKERLQTNVFAGTPYGHPVLGTIKGIEAITLDDVKNFWKTAYTQGALKVGIAGNVSDDMVADLNEAIAKLPAGAGLPATAAITGKRPSGLEVEIIEKNTRATAISFGLPIAVTRSHPDYPALWVAKTWLGEHRASNSHLYQRIREERGMNYGDYAYIEAFPRGMFQFFPDPNLGRKAQLFEVWIRPVAPENAHMALRIALHELTRLVDNGLSKEEFETTRDYLMKNVFVMTATQNQQLGYAMDAQWYGLPEYTRMMRDALGKMTAADVNAAIKKHLSAKDLSVVFITRDAAGLKAKLLSDEFSPIKYDGQKSKALLDEDQLIGNLKLSIRPEAVVITPAEKAFAE
ncbi:MAG TPA: pitrilysin family protein [Usitatibacteraceae bacterium]